MIVRTTAGLVNTEGVEALTINRVERELRV